MSQTRKLPGVAILAMSVSTTLTACGETKGERAISGGAIGAGAGTAAGAVTGEHIGGCGSGRRRWRGHRRLDGQG